MEQEELGPPLSLKERRARFEAASAASLSASSPGVPSSPSNLIRAASYGVSSKGRNLGGVNVEGIPVSKVVRHALPGMIPPTKTSFASSSPTNTTPLATSIPVSVDSGAPSSSPAVRKKPTENSTANYPPISSLSSMAGSHSASALLPAAKTGASSVRSTSPISSTAKVLVLEAKPGGNGAVRFGDSRTSNIGAAISVGKSWDIKPGISPPGPKIPSDIEVKETSTAPPKPQWLNRPPPSTVPSEQPLPSTSKSIPAPPLPPRSSTLPMTTAIASSTSSVVGPILPPRPRASVSRTFSVTGPNLSADRSISPSPSRQNRHRAPAAEFTSISLSGEGANLLATSLLSHSNISTSEQTLTSTPIVSSSTLTPPAFPPRRIQPPPVFPSVSSSTITPSKLSTYSPRTPISPMAQRKPVDPRSRLRYEALHERLLSQMIGRESDSSITLEKGPAWIKKRTKLDGDIVRWIWEKSRLKKDFLRKVWDTCDAEKQGSLDKDSFTNGMWIIDEELRRNSRGGGRITSRIR